MENSSPIHHGAPYFMGSHALIKFSSDTGGEGPTTHWLADKTNHTIRPFESETALQNAFGNGYQTAIQHVVTIAPPTISSDGEITDGVLRDFNILSPEYAIKEDGSAKKLDFSPHELRSRYGKAVNPQAEQRASSAVEKLLDGLKSKEGETGVKPSFIDHIKKDHHLMAFYISALAYGEYHLTDVYHDVIRRHHRSVRK